jgi:hypothetical protein
MIVSHTVHGGVHRCHGQEFVVCWFQQLQYLMQWLRAVQPKIVICGLQNRGHPIVDCANHRVRWSREQTTREQRRRASPTIPKPSEGHRGTCLGPEQVWRLRFADPLPLDEPAGGNQAALGTDRIPKRRQAVNGFGFGVDRSGAVIWVFGPGWYQAPLHRNQSTGDAIRLEANHRDELRRSHVVPWLKARGVQQMEMLHQFRIGRVENVASAHASKIAANWAAVEIAASSWPQSVGSRKRMMRSKRLHRQLENRRGSKLTTT